MSSPTRALLAASLLCAVAIAGAARADVYVYFSVVGTGAQFEFGDARPLPLQPPRTAMGGPIGTKSKFPPLSIPITGQLVRLCRVPREELLGLANIPR